MSAFLFFIQRQAFYILLVQEFSDGHYTVIVEQMYLKSHLFYMELMFDPVYCIFSIVPELLAPDLFNKRLLLKQSELGEIHLIVVLQVLSKFSKEDQAGKEFFMTLSVDQSHVMG